MLPTENGTIRLLRPTLELKYQISLVYMNMRCLKIYRAATFEIVQDCRLILKTGSEVPNVACTDLGSAITEAARQGATGGKFGANLLATIPQMTTWGSIADV